MKEAITRYAVHELIKKRWSPRAFSDKTIETDDMKAILEAATWAPSSSNEQPWRYQYAYKDTPGFETLWNCLVEGNRSWTKNAAVLIVCIAKKTFIRNGKENRHYMHDCGLANENLLLQAASMDIYGHPMAGFSIPDTIETLKLKNDEEPVCFIALGHMGNAGQLEEPNRTRETAARSRKPIEEISADISHYIFGEK